jgi:hypothetical protein
MIMPAISPTTLNAAAGDDSIHPFRVNVPQEEIVEPGRHIAATRWREKETVADQSQGSQLAAIRGLGQ